MVGAMEQFKTPLYNQLVLHKEKKSISLHVPGHKSGSLIPVEKAEVYKELLKIDVTELTGLDDLHSPEGVILEAEQLLAKLYGVKKSFFLVNGSTVGNLAMMLSAVDENDLILVQRNCHKSILNGLQLAKANPIFLSPEYDEEWMVAGGISFETVEAAIRRFPKAKAIILTYPNYYGMVYDLKRIINLAHAHQIPVLIDEAHGAHLIAGELFPASSVELGADLVVQSAHKTLPAMTMGSFLHFNSELVPLSAIKQHLQMLQSSSPSYPIMASLDIARSYLGTYNGEDAHYLRNEIRQFRGALAKIQGIRILPFPNNYGDFLKVTVQSTCSLTGYELQKRLEQQGVYSELADPINVLFILPLLKRNSPFPFAEIVDRIELALKGTTKHKQKPPPERLDYKRTTLSKPAMSYQEMNKHDVKKASLLEAIGKVAAEMITPYPPGIPLLFPGEIITAEDIKQIRLLLAKGARFQGGESLRDGEGFIQIY